MAYADSEGHFVEPPQHYNQQLEKIARLQQAGERRQKGSAGKREHYQRLAKAHLHIAQQRKQTRLKIVDELLSRCGVLYIEEAPIRDVLTTPVKVWNEEKKRYEKTGRRDKAEENRAIADLGWAAFMQVVQQQAPKFGVCVEVVRLSEEEHDLEPLERAKIVLDRGLSGEV